MQQYPAACEYEKVQDITVLVTDIDIGAAPLVQHEHKNNGIQRYSQCSVCGVDSTLTYNDHSHSVGPG